MHSAQLQLQMHSKYYCFGNGLAVIGGNGPTSSFNPSPRSHRHGPVTLILNLIPSTAFMYGCISSASFEYFSCTHIDIDTEEDESE